MEAAIGNVHQAGVGQRRQHPWWREILAPYTKPRLGRSLLDFMSSAVPYLGLSTGMYFLLDVSYWLALVVAVPAAGFLLRTFILFHDCAHGSFLPRKRANEALGTALGLLVYSSFLPWRHEHAVHHATAGDLDRRGVGDVPTYTVSEYRALSWRGRLGYRLFRNPFVMFGLGPVWALVINPRLTHKDMRPRLRRSIHLTNLALVVIIALICWAIGWREFLLVQAPTAWLAGAAGVFLFYVQHQFEDVYWENTDSWTYADAALRGSSFLDLPRWLHFFTGNIGYHHLHHLQARIPNYNLPRAHELHPAFQDVPTLSLSDAFKASRLKLYDERRGRLITWRELRAAPPAAA
jgi:acyl-lipid omega-6 desaturase (Delta-12 desaturase)